MSTRLRFERLILGLKRFLLLLVGASPDKYSGGGSSITSIVSYIIGGGDDREVEGDASFNIERLAFDLRSRKLRVDVRCIDRATVSERSGVGYEELFNDCEAERQGATLLDAFSALSI